MRLWSVIIKSNRYRITVPVGFCGVTALESCCRIWYIIDEKRSNRPQGVDLMIRIIELPPHYSAKVPGWFFYALKHYRQNVNTNVSNAKMNVPKAIRSLKSNGLLSISTTPILCKNRGQPPCNTIAPWLILSWLFHCFNPSYKISMFLQKIPKLYSGIGLLF